MKAYVRKGKVAKAKIILHLDKSQLPHARLDTAKEIWNNLACIHRARGFGTLLAMRWRRNGWRWGTDEFDNHPTDLLMTTSV